MRSTIAIGVAGGEEFTAERPLRPRRALVMLLDSAVDSGGAFGRRQNDLRAALDGDGTVLLLIGPRIAEGLATQFGVWVRAKIGADILPYSEPRALENGNTAYAAVRFFAGSLPESAERIVRSRAGELVGLRFRAGDATVVLAPLGRRAHGRRPARADRGTAMRRLAQLLAAIAVVVIVLTGLWFVAGRVTDDFVASGILTAAWFGVAGLAALLIARRWRVVAVPVVAAFVLTAGGAGLYLAASLQDKVVHEQIASAAPGTGNRLVSSGSFSSGAHDTSGAARVVQLRRGDRVLTLDLRTDAGSDLRVYLAPGDGSNVDDNVDLGGLKGNIGTQQYAIPAGTDLGRYTAVVIWCRAFSVNFGSAVLRRA
jgi:hypothetical protein